MNSLQVSHEEKEKEKNQTIVFVFPEKQDHYFLVYSQVMNYNTGSGFESALDRRHAYQGTALG